jgi:hypothetical protein
MSRRDTPAAVASPPHDADPDDPTLEEFLRPLRDRYRFLEDYFNLQAEAVFASCPTEMSPDGLFGLNEICREGGDLLDDLLDQLPRHVVNLRVRNVLELGPSPGGRARRRATERRASPGRGGADRDAAARDADDEDDDEADD